MWRFWIWLWRHRQFQIQSWWFIITGSRYFRSESIIRKWVMGLRTFEETHSCTNADSPQRKFEIQIFLHFAKINDHKRNFLKNSSKVYGLFSEWEKKWQSEFKMPHLHRNPFVPNEIPADLDPKEKVYYCESTGEIFR